MIKNIIVAATMTVLIALGAVAMAFSFALGQGGDPVGAAMMATGCLACWAWSGVIMYIADRG